MEKDVIDLLIEEENRIVEISGKRIKLDKLSYGQIIKIIRILGSVLSQITDKMKELKDKKSDDKFSEIKIILDLLDEKQITELLSIILKTNNIEKINKLSTKIVVELFVFIIENDLKETLKNLQGIEAIKNLFQKKQ